MNQRKWKSCRQKPKYFWEQVAVNTRNLLWRQGAHPLRLNTNMWPIANKYREGKVKRTPKGEWNRTWNLVPTSRESTKVWSRTFCRMGQRVILYSKIKHFRCAVQAKASLNRAIVVYDRPETGWSIHGQSEGEVKFTGGSNRVRFKTHRMNCG